MFEQLATADVAVVDITNLNPNVFYELGARHALAKSVTVLIRKRGGATPFNIQDLRVIEYPGENGRMSEAREKIQRFIENGLKSGEADSPIRGVLERVKAEDPVAADRGTPKLRAPPPRAARQGDRDPHGRPAEWPGVDVWVNSENTNMQMARFYDRNLSAVIRYSGARKNENEEIVEDTIADELAAKMSGRESVSVGTVFDTSAGALADTHGVKRIFHVALVQGVPGGGYRASRDMIDTCASRCLRRMDAGPGTGETWRSITFPMMGTGAGGEDVGQLAKILIGSSLRYLQQQPGSVIERVIFMAWNRRDLAGCIAAVPELPGLEPVAAAG